MTSFQRLAAVALLALLLPVQGFAAACAQICAVVHQAHHAEMMAATGDDDHGALAGHCGDSDMGAGKCCKAHTFLVDLAVPVVAAPPSFLEHTSFVARWTNFIPEEPSPPPIAVLRSA